MRKSVEVREERLARAWEALPPESELATVEGEPVRVVYPGRRNGGPGPDFLDAVIETGAGEVRGAVEVHQRTSDWERHGHGADQSYRGVVLHVVGAHDGATSRPPGGTQLPLLELAGGPSSGAAQRRYACSGSSAVEGALARAGEARLEANVARLSEALAARPGDEEQLAYEEIAAALGYARNSVPLRELAAAVPLERVRTFAGCLSGAPGSALRAEALLLGGAGLLPSQRHLPTRRRRDAYAGTLERVWKTAGTSAALRAYRWDHGQSRPENSPVRRVVALAHVALAWPGGGLLPAVRTALLGKRGRSPAALAGLVSVTCPDGYWLTHWDFGVAAKGASGGALAHDAGNETPALVGAGRAADVVVNVLLPLAAALGDAALAGTARAAYECHPALAENWITRLVRERSALAAPLNARAQQGLIHVYEQTCRALKCGECVLGAR
ncbi:MAG TPA: DUF2851 family protein [Chloroflexota bacterium]|nr:DUF2851 family protein [Chloroflexota bacterium]